MGLVREIYSNGFDILNSYEIVYLRRCLFIFGAAHVVIILPRWVSTGRYVVSRIKRGERIETYHESF